MVPLAGRLFCQLPCWMSKRLLLGQAMGRGVFLKKLTDTPIFGMLEFGVPARDAFTRSAERANFT